jgi:death-on-curing family protein
MAGKRASVSQLAHQSGLDVDEVLLTLWEAGFSELRGPGDRLGRGELNRARRVLGLATRRELSTAAYWMNLFDLTKDEFDELLRLLGLTPVRSGSGLPRRAVSRLRKECRRKQIDPSTGLRVAIEHTAVPSSATAPLAPTSEQFRFDPPGHPRDLEFLSAEQVESIHFALVDDFVQTQDPIDPPGVKSRSMLESAVHRPQTSNGEYYKYPTVESAGAALLHALVLNHPFHNGNKRTALVALLVFIDENGLFPEFDDDDLFRMVLQVASHRIVDPALSNLTDREVLAISNWLCSHTRWADRAEHPMPWRKLRRILATHECTCEFANVGNRLNITRNVPTVGLLRRKKLRSLRTQVAYTDDGRDADVSVIKKIRTDLELDDEHGIDSKVFYYQDPPDPKYFITKYRKILKRLARM